VRRIPILSLRLLLLGLVTLAITLLGRWTTLHQAFSCTTWPLCWPQGGKCWLDLLHRGLVLLALLLLGDVLRRAWRDYRQDETLLPLATLLGVLFGGQVLIGALLVQRGNPLHLLVLHALTMFALWADLLILAWLSLSRSPQPLSQPRRWQDFFMLTKPLIVGLLLITTLGGMVAGARAWPHPTLMFWTLLGGALAAGGSGMINQYIDREIDRHMQRTARRPLAAGRITPAEALAFGLALCLISYYLLAGFVNLTAALLSLAGILYYVFLYSIVLKRRTVQNIVIGGGAGAIPPLVGWAAVTGSLDWPAFFLFLIIFLWTPPHFWALSIVRRKDYERAGVPMLPVVRGEQETRRQIWLYTIVLVTVTWLMRPLGMAGNVYFFSAIVLGIWLLTGAWRVWRQAGKKVTWQMYRWSSMYLFFLFLALMVDRMMPIP
jgi:protoheme IX farnesyltransferase